MSLQTYFGGKMGKMWFRREMEKLKMITRFEDDSGLSNWLDSTSCRDGQMKTGYCNRVLFCFVFGGKMERLKFSFWQINI